MRTDYAQRLMFNGFVVFLLGLVIGFFSYIGMLWSGQLGVIAHLEGLLNGMFLAILGLIWGRMVLSERQQRFTYWLAIGSVYLNYGQAAWFAKFGRYRATTLFPANRTPFSVLETMVLDGALLFLTLGFITCAVMILWGLRRGLSAQRAVPLTNRVPA